MRIFRFALLSLALICGAFMAPALPVSAQSAVTDRQSVSAQIVTNLKLFDLLLWGGKRGLAQAENVQAMAERDQALLATLFENEMYARRDAMITELAAANMGQLDDSKLNTLLTLSRIKYVQDLVLAGGDPSLANPDPDSMTDTEASFFEATMSEPWVGAFFDGFNYETVSPYMVDATHAAFDRLNAQGA